jgi:hypothetical protein
MTLSRLAGRVVIKNTPLAAGDSANSSRTDSRVSTAAVSPVLWASVVLGFVEADASQVRSRKRCHSSSYFSICVATSFLLLHLRVIMALRRE